MEHPAIVPLGLQLAFTDQIDESNIAGVLTPLSLLERCDIAVAQNGGTRHQPVPLVHQNEIHEQTGSASIPVLEGMNVNQSPVSVGN